MTISGDNKLVESILLKYPDLEASRSQLHAYYETRNAWTHPLSSVIFYLLDRCETHEQAEKIARQLAELDWATIFRGAELCEDFALLDHIQKDGGHCDKCKNFQRSNLYPLSLIHPDRLDERLCFACFDAEQQRYIHILNMQYRHCGSCHSLERIGDLVYKDEGRKLRFHEWCKKCVAKREDELRITCKVCGVITINHIAKDTCDGCYRKEPTQSYINTHLGRAKKGHTPATLTLDQWTQTVTFFDYKCAYCGKPYEVLEHAVPISQGGGTTQENCLPACIPCNATKKNLPLIKNLDDRSWGSSFTPQAKCIPKLKQWLSQFAQSKESSAS